MQCIIALFLLPVVLLLSSSLQALSLSINGLPAFGLVANTKTALLHSPHHSQKRWYSTKMASSSSVANNNTSNRKQKLKKMYSFVEARLIARGHGFSNKEEFLEYSCAGAYQLPKNPHVVWGDDGWNGWDDFLGVPFASYDEAKDVVKTHLSAKITKTMEAYLAFMKNRSKCEGYGTGDDAVIGRLPYRPDKFYKSQWRGWDDWLDVDAQ